MKPQVPPLRYAPVGMTTLCEKSMTRETRFCGLLLGRGSAGFDTGLVEAGGTEIRGNDCEASRFEVPTRCQFDREAELLAIGGMKTKVKSACVLKKVPFL